MHYTRARKLTRMHRGAVRENDKVNTSHRKTAAQALGPIRETDARRGCAYFHFHEPFPQFEINLPLECLFIINELYIGMIVELCTFSLPKQFCQKVCSYFEETHFQTRFSRILLLSRWALLDLFVKTVTM